MKISFNKIKDIAMQMVVNLIEAICLIDLENIPDGGAFEYQGQKYIKMLSIDWPKEKSAYICHPVDNFYERITLAIETKVKPVFDDDHK